MAGDQFLKKSFMVGPGTLNGNGKTTDNFKLLDSAVVTDEERAEWDKKTKADSERIEKEIAADKLLKKAGRKKIIPYGDRIVVQRRKIKNNHSSAIILPGDVEERQTEVADVVAMPDMTFADKMLLENAEQIITSLTEMAKDGDAGALNSLMSFNTFLRLKTLKVGDMVMVGKYQGIDFTVGETGEQLSITDYDGIRGLIVESK